MMSEARSTSNGPSAAPARPAAIAAPSDARSFPSVRRVGCPPRIDTVPWPRRTRSANELGDDGAGRDREADHAEHDGHELDLEPQGVDRGLHAHDLALDSDDPAFDGRD